MTAEGDGETAKSETRELTVSRLIDAPPHRVYEAFVDPEELAEWMHPPGASCEIHHLEPEVGGTYQITMQGETPDGGKWSHTYGGTFVELVPGERIVQTEVAESDDPAMADEVTVSVTFEPVPNGTDVSVAMSVPVAWPDDGIAGWAGALGNLADRLEDA